MEVTMYIEVTMYMEVTSDWGSYVSLSYNRKWNESNFLLSVTSKVIIGGHYVDWGHNVDGGHQVNGGHQKDWGHQVDGGHYVAGNLNWLRLLCIAMQQQKKWHESNFFQKVTSTTTTPSTIGFLRPADVIPQAIKLWIFLASENENSLFDIMYDTAQADYSPMIPSLSC